MKYLLFCIIFNKRRERRYMMNKIIVASKNKNKIKEINEIIKEEGLNFLAISMEEADINIDVVEDGTTFEENATKKAVQIGNLAKTITLSDDSGLVIDFLNGEPGVYSARYLGETTPYETKNQHILDLLKNVPPEKRSARFVSSIAICLENGKSFTTTRTMEGFIGFEAKGENGFGYDPIFYTDINGKSNSQLTIEEKNKISHRGKALRTALKALDEHINYEIEKKYLIDLNNISHLDLSRLEQTKIIQGYISKKPVIRIRKTNTGNYLTIKGNSLFKRKEYELEICNEEFETLLTKVSGNLIKKTRYYIKLENDLIGELDIYEDNLKGFANVEVEFNNMEEANKFIPPEYFGKDVTLDKKYSNSNLTEIEKINELF